MIPEPLARPGFTPALLAALLSPAAADEQARKPPGILDFHETARAAADPAGLVPLWAMTLRPEHSAAPVSRTRPSLGGRGMIDLWREVDGRDPRHVPIP